jgi:hypothetical protein
MCKVMISLTCVLFGVTCLFAEAGGDVPDEAAKAQADLLSKVRESNKTYAVLFSEVRARGASGSLDKAAALVDEAIAAQIAYRDMLTVALKQRPADEIAFVLIRGLSDFELPAQGMEAVFFYLGSKEGAMSAAAVKDQNTREAIAWLELHPHYPAYTVLLKQGTRAVPFLKGRIPELQAASVVFQNAFRLLIELVGREGVARWAEKENRLTPEQKESVKALLAPPTEQRKASTTK